MAFVEGDYTQRFKTFLRSMPHVHTKLLSHKKCSDYDEEMGLLQHTPQKRRHEKHRTWPHKLPSFGTHLKRSSRHGYLKLRHSCPGRLADNSVNLDHTSVSELHTIQAEAESPSKAVAKKTTESRMPSELPHTSIGDTANCKPYSELKTLHKQVESNKTQGDARRKSYQRVRRSSKATSNYGATASVTFQSRAMRKLSEECFNIFGLPRNPQMYGRYRQELSQFAKNEAARQKEEQKRQRQLDDEFRQYKGTCCFTFKCE